MKPVVAIVQARMTSKRLPGKVLMDVCGKPAMQRMLERVMCAQYLDKILVATTCNEEDDPIVDLCRRFSIATFRGDEFDVLGRFLSAAEKADAHSVVRLTADCPMIDPAVIDQIVRKFNSGNWDYVSNCGERTYPDGLDAEIFTLQALKVANLKATHPFLREHVTPFIRGSHPQYGSGRFRRTDVKFDADLSHLRWTLDTIEDLQRIRKLVSLLPENYTWFDALTVATKFPDLLGLPSSSDD